MAYVTLARRALLTKHFKYNLSHLCTKHDLGEMLWNKAKKSLIYHNLNKILPSMHLKCNKILKEFDFILTWAGICWLWVCFQSPNKHCNSSLSRRQRGYIDIKHHAFTHTTRPSDSFFTEYCCTIWDVWNKPSIVVKVKR